MSDLNDDIKKYLKGELSPAEMHALEKKALDDPFIEEALEGVLQLDSNAFDSDLKNLGSSLEDRISKRPGRTVSLWAWPARIAAGLILVAISTFVIVKLTGNDPEGDLALQESASAPKDNADEQAVPDSMSLSRDITKQLKYEPAKPQSPAPARDERDSETTASRPIESGREGGASGPAAASKTEGDTQAEQTTAKKNLAQATEVVPEEQPAQDAVEKEVAVAKKSQATAELADEDQRERVPSTAPASRAKAAPGLRYTPKVVSGRVVSEDGIGLPGVNVMIKDTNIGTVTDASGNYQISVAENNPSLVFSFIGFTSEEVVAGDKTKVDIKLSEDVSQLSEIVVVGYGTDKRSDDEEKLETLELANPYGGRRAYKQYLEKNIQYPEQALANNVEGKVTIQFTVESSGQLSDFRVIKGIGHGCEEEVMRLVKQGPKWNPTRRNTESLRDRVKVRMKFTLPKK